MAFPGYPKTKYHPVTGAVTVEDPNAEAKLQPEHDYFDTPEEADMHRTEREAAQAIHYNNTVKINAKLEGRTIDINDPKQAGTGGVVRNSVAATENYKTGALEPY